MEIKIDHSLITRNRYGAIACIKVWNSGLYIGTLSSEGLIDPSGSFINKKVSFKTVREAIGVVKKYYKVRKLRQDDDWIYFKGTSK